MIQHYTQRKLQSTACSAPSHPPWKITCYAYDKDAYQTKKSLWASNHNKHSRMHTWVCECHALMNAPSPKCNKQESWQYLSNTLILMILKYKLSINYTYRCCSMWLVMKLWRYTSRIFDPTSHTYNTVPFYFWFIKRPQSRMHNRIHECVYGSV